jgi:hypothetical protein
VFRSPDGGRACGARTGSASRFRVQTKGRAERRQAAPTAVSLSHTFRANPAQMRDLRELGHRTGKSLCPTCGRTRQRGLPATAVGARTLNRSPEGRGRHIGRGVWRSFLKQDLSVQRSNCSMRSKSLGRFDDPVQHGESSRARINRRGRADRICRKFFVRCTASV